MVKLSVWTRRLVVLGLIAIPIVALTQDIGTGKDLALAVIGGFLGMLRSED